MKALVRREYGPPEALRIEEIDRPAPQAGEVLVKVRAAALNPLDRHFMRGTPYLLRMGEGLSRPRSPQLGIDLAGEVEMVGAGVEGLEPGDAVLGPARGAFAEWACASAGQLVEKPDGISFEQAATLNIAGVSALQGLRDMGRIQRGHKVLVNGAAGGVGTFAVQLARHFGAEVTGVCSAKNVDMVRSIGAHHVIDYAQEDFTKDDRRYDVILDCIGQHPLSSLKRVLEPRGAYVHVGGAGGRWLGPIPRIIAMLVLAPPSGRRMGMLMSKRSTEDLTLITVLVASGNVTPVIDRCYKLSEAAAAMRHLESGHARGKIVITP